MLRRTVDPVNEVGVNLAQGDERPTFAPLRYPNLVEEKLAVAFDGGAGVVFGEAEIESVSAVDAGNSAMAGGEGVNEPREIGQLFGMQELQFGFWDGLGRHDSIILKSWPPRLKPSFLAAGGGT